MEEILRQLMEIVQETTPAVWAIARRQVASIVVQMLVCCVLCLIGTVMLVRLAAFCQRKHRDMYDDWDLARSFSIAGAVVSGLFATGLAIDLIMHLINPEYYTIKVLLSLIGT